MGGRHMPDINAIANNDTVLISWRYGGAIADCLGFNVERQDNDAPGQGWKALPTWVGFKG